MADLNNIINRFTGPALFRSAKRMDGTFMFTNSLTGQVVASAAGISQGIPPNVPPSAQAVAQAQVQAQAQAAAKAAEEKKTEDAKKSKKGLLGLAVAAAGIYYMTRG
jgi:hypothetical protein